MSNIRQEILEAIKEISIYSRPAIHLIELPIINNGANDVVAFDLLAGKKPISLFGLSGNSLVDIDSLSGLILSGINDVDKILLNLAIIGQSGNLYAFFNSQISLTGTGSTIEYTAGQLDKFYCLTIS